MEVRTYTKGASFLDVANAFLMTAEAENNVLISVAQSPQAEIARQADRAVLLAVLNKDGFVECAASQHQEAGLFISESTNGGAVALCDYLAHNPGAIKRVQMPKSIAAQWVEAWTAYRSCTSTLRMNTRYYRCDRVVWPRPCQGDMRAAFDQDVDIVASLWQTFLREAWDMDESLENLLPAVSRSIREGRMHLWVDKEPVAYLLWGGLTQNGGRVIQVLTSEGRRRRGYASNLTAKVTHTILEDGKAFCVIEADLKNPHSNRIYQELGYRPIVDRQEWHFECPD